MEGNNVSTHDAIDTLGEIEDSLDEMLNVSLLLDEGQAVMIREAKSRVVQVQKEMIEFNLSDDSDVEVEFDERG